MDVLADHVLLHGGRERFAVAQKAEKCVDFGHVVEENSELVAPHARLRRGRGAAVFLSRGSEHALSQSPLPLSLVPALSRAQGAHFLLHQDTARALQRRALTADFSVHAFLSLVSARL